VLRLGHLNIDVHDLDRAVSFYAQWFGFDRVLAEYPDRTLFVTDATGFELALHEGAATRTERDWHFGFLAPDVATVRTLMASMATAGIAVADAEDTDAYVGYKCRDPDGHVIEVYFEPRSRVG
jgi:catechol 2,3-dioxygenase-like lactoylglutathione lyase family enzyme